jgi:hypothetical protein
VSKSKDIGTWTETQVVKHARASGFPHADRHVLKGSLDEGDVWLDPTGRLIVEVKGGKSAESASDSQVRAWLDETERERQHAGASYAFLALKRAGKGAQQRGAWWAVCGLPHLADAYDSARHSLSGCNEGAVMRTTLDDMLSIFVSRFGVEETS